MAINQNNGNDGEFDDDIFDGEDFNDQDFDPEAFDETVTDDMDADFADDGFEDADWQEEDNAAPAGKQNSLYQTGEKKGLSFNTIVIIGAVVVGGGVMMMTVMNKSAEVSAGNQNVFQSMLSMVGVMDGELAGPVSPEATQEQQTAQEDGFLNNPSSLSQLNQDANPPQPVPMAPEEAQQDINEPLVPLPDDIYAGTPRGPEEAVPLPLAEEPTPAQQNEPVTSAEATAPVSAEDILKQAMANREKKLNDVASPAPAADIVQSAPSTSVTDPEPVASVTPLPTPATATPSASSEELAENTKALEKVTTSITDMVTRLERMEGDITAVREAKDTQYQQMEKAIASLKEDVAQIKARPIAQPAPVKAAAVTSVADEQDDDPVEQEVQKPVQKKAVKPAKVSTPVSKAPTQEVQSSNWQLRAAQPGRAWISRSGQRDMQGVEVGQTIAGIGRITAITYQNGRWSVIGTQGNIQQ